MSNLPLTYNGDYRLWTPHAFYSYPNIILQIKSRRMRWVGHAAHIGEESEVYRVLVGKPEGKRPLIRPRCRREDGIRMGDWLGESTSSCLRVGDSGRLL
jgi:hypothetical protein